MDRVNPPQGTAMQRSMRPVVNEVGEHQDLEALQPRRLTRERPEAARQEIAGDPVKADAQGHRKKSDCQDGARDASRQQWRREPIRKVKSEPLPEEQGLA